MELQYYQFSETTIRKHEIKKILGYIASDTGSVPRRLEVLRTFLINEIEKSYMKNNNYYNTLIKLYNKVILSVNKIEAISNTHKEKDYAELLHWFSAEFSVLLENELRWVEGL